MERVIPKLFRRVVGRPCWGVEWDPRTNLSLSFGRPHLEIREPRQTRARSEKVRRQFAHRLVVVRGDYWLWIYCARWQLSLADASPVTGASSGRAIREALRFLGGQRLERIEVDARTGRTRFFFDLGARLDVRRIGPDSDEDLWILYAPDGRALAVRGDGRYSHQPASAPARYFPL